MNRNGVGGEDWQGALGKRWASHLEPLEGLLEPVDAPLVEALRLDEARRVADLGCGGGGATMAIREASPDDATVDGFDLSEELVARARHRAGALPISFRVADLQTDAPPEGPYDRLASRFGMMFFSDPPAAFQNVSRWLTPGGHFAFAVWGPPQDNAWVSLARETVASVADLPPPQPDAPGPFRYADTSLLLPHLDAAGFSDLRVRDWRGRLQVGGGMDAVAAADFALSAFGAMASALDEAGPAAWAQAKSTLADHYRAREVDGVVHVDARVHVVTGTR